MSSRDTLLHDSYQADNARTSFCLCLNPGKVGAPWLADPGPLIGEDLVSALSKAIRLIQGCALHFGEAVMIYIIQRCPYIPALATSHSLYLSYAMY